MPANEIHKNDVGTEFRCTIKDDDAVVDISTVTTKQLLFRKPDGTILTKTASFYSDGTDGVLTYSSIAGDLDQCGLWELQGFVAFGANEFHSDIRNFTVHRNIN